MHGTEVHQLPATCTVKRLLRSKYPTGALSADREAGSRLRLSLDGTPIRTKLDASPPGKWVVGGPAAIARITII